MGTYSSTMSSQTAPGQLLCSSPGFLVIAWTGLRRPSLLFAYGVACPAAPRRWSSCPCPPELHGLPSWTSYLAADARTDSERPLVPLPRAWLDFSATRSCYAGTLSGIYQPSAAAWLTFWTPSAFLCIFPDGCHALPGRSIDPTDLARRSGLHTGLAGRYLPVHTGQDDEYIGCCSNPADRRSLYPHAEYGPQFTMEAESL